MIKIVTYLFVLTHSDCILLILDYRKRYIMQINLLIQVNHRFYFYCSYISFECRKIKSIEWAGDLCKINGACTSHWSDMKFTHVWNWIYQFYFINLFHIFILKILIFGIKVFFNFFYFKCNIPYIMDFPIISFSHASTVIWVFIFFKLSPYITRKGKGRFICFATPYP